jgi:hypothetical protein
VLEEAQGDPRTARLDAAGRAALEPLLVLVVGVEELLDRARGDGVEAVYLLTLTAREYFARLGFVAVDRAQAPAEIRRSEEFASICPVSSAFMGKQISPP